MSSIIGPKITVELLAKARTEELKKAIDDFKAGKIAVEELEKKTKDLKDSSSDLGSAYKALQQAHRVNNFEMLEGIRVLRSFTSVARDLNQVYQTITLRNIEGAQTSVAQREAFADLQGQVEKLGTALTIFGPNGDVQKGFSDIIGKADDLSSLDIQKLIDQAEGLKSSLKLTPEQLAELDKFILKLQDLKKETISDEDKKKWEDYFGIFTNAALAAGGVTTLAGELSKHGTALAGLLRFVAASKPEIAIIILLLFGEPIARELGLIQSAGDPSVDTVKPGTINPKTGQPYSFERGPDGRVPDQGDYTNIEINMDRVFLNSLDEDTRSLATHLIDEIERRRAQKAP